ncbi:helix-turn-helix domain-containing protein [Streptomyces sp. NPDC018019]|uniref:helix-turn-helix domain-containing protein n=1 Tax=Streptomyces sp. NPDC018019 TaxID=3365030 RepID=UPI0037AF52AB
MNDKQPAEQGDKPTATHSGEAPWTSGEIDRRVRRNRRLSDAEMRRLSDADMLREQILTLIEEHERKTVAARALAGDPNPTDADPLEYVQEIAEHYAQRDHRPTYLDQLADELTLDDVRTLRLAGEAAQAVTPRVIMRAAEGGKQPREIAAEIGLTESRVYGVLREERRKGHEAEQGATGDQQ